MTYISLCKHPIQISTVQSEEQHVMKNLPKFHLNRTVNESGNAVLRKLRRPGKLVAPSARISSPAPGGTKLPPGGSSSAKIQKTAFFVNQNTTHHLYGAWRPKGCRQAVPAPANLMSCTSFRFQSIAQPHRMRISSQMHSFNHSLQIFP